MGSQNFDYLPVEDIFLPISCNVSGGQVESNDEALLYLPTKAVSLETWWRIYSCITVMKCPFLLTWGIKGDIMGNLDFYANQEVTS